LLRDILTPLNHTEDLLPGSPAHYPYPLLGARGCELYHGLGDMGLLEVGPRGPHEA